MHTSTWHVPYQSVRGNVRTVWYSFFLARRSFDFRPEWYYDRACLMARFGRFSRFWPKRFLLVGLLNWGAASWQISFFHSVNFICLVALSGRYRRLWQKRFLLVGLLNWGTTFFTYQVYCFSSFFFCIFRYRPTAVGHGIDFDCSSGYLSARIFFIWPF